MRRFSFLPVVLFVPVACATVIFSSISPRKSCSLLLTLNSEYLLSLSSSCCLLKCTPAAFVPGSSLTSSSSLTTFDFSCSVYALPYIADSNALAASSTFTASLLASVVAGADDWRYLAKNRSSQTTDSAR
ncbi:hypothetical protein NP493_692g03000 [Ridgeia piscesae]|uniref:Secreted protein n=1 Tax=Ridgeia piscesae TaxID=27915 RepID=A0AAD9KRF6_RIDPI|nr:hypothetical protein NP493_692g03000 [Ridgeia piscesae]